MSRCDHRQFQLRCIPQSALRDLCRRANAGEAEARTLLFRQLTPIQQAELLDRWEMPLTPTFDCLGEMIFA